MDSKYDSGYFQGATCIYDSAVISEIEQRWDAKSVWTNAPSVRCLISDLPATDTAGTHHLPGILKLLCGVSAKFPKEKLSLNPKLSQKKVPRRRWDF